MFNNFCRQMLHLPDGGQIGLDWAKRAEGTDNTVLLIIPGLSGERIIIILTTRANYNTAIR